MKYFVIQWPWMLCLLVLVVPLAALLARARRKRHELRMMLGAGEATGERGRDALRLAALVLLVFALSRPGYAPERRPVSQSGRDVVFAIDVSRSMLAEDAQPSRLEAAKQGVRDALAGFGSERAGLVIYAGSATILCPLTYDYDFVRYMLEQANPRAVDFGGTTVLSAVEKSVDNVFTDERRGMQDLVVLTDGEDHVPNAGRVAELLKEQGVDLLLVGLGDVTAASRIPIETGEGGRSYLKQDSDFVSTRLNEEGLREVAEKCEGATFVAPGTAAFDLSAIYANHALGKPVAGAMGADGFVVYQEAGFWLIGIALVLLVVAGRVGRAGLGVMVCLAMVQPLRGESMDGRFVEARKLQLEGRCEEALEIYGELDGGSPVQAAAVSFNEGLCHLKLAADLGERAPDAALAAARRAQRSLLEAKRLDQGLDRAGMRLDGTAALIGHYARLLKEREEQERELQEQLGAIVERLKTLLEKQAALHLQVRDKAPKKLPPSRRNVESTPQVAPVPEDDLRGFVDSQGKLGEGGRSIRGDMENLETVMVVGMPEGTPREMGMMGEPLRLMGEAIAAQGQAAEQLADWQSWQTAAARQQIAITRIEEILALLEGGDSSDSEEGDEEGEWDDEEDWEDTESSEEGAPSSMPMAGDLAAGGEMAPLPVPNYSAEDLLMEEQGNMQFREQQRAKAQEGKVKKDW